VVSCAIRPVHFSTHRSRSFEQEKIILYLTVSVFQLNSRSTLFHMIIPVLQTAGAVVTATLALSSGLNMYQTFQVSRGMNDENDLAFRLCIEERMPSSRRLQVALDEIVGLSRSDALKCFKTSCRAPLSLSEIGGEWDGILLDNNGIIMVRICYDPYVRSFILTDFSFFYTRQNFLDF
jgi:hypothetical protein